jgi:Na+/H+-dicarboxylate symporter
VNAIRMTVVPLVVSLLVTRVVAAPTDSVGRIGGRAVLLFALLAGAGAIYSAVLAPPLVSALPLDESALAAVRARATAPSVDLPPFRDWLTGLVPPNPVKAAADGALLPLVVFTVCFALALTRASAEPRQAVARFFEAVTAAMFVLVRWVIAVSPIGVFALAFALAARGGVGVATALGQLVVLVSALLLVGTLALYPLVGVLGVPIRRFARACAPGQAIAFSTRSSLASLPALVERAERDLGVPPQVAGLVLPIAVSIFKYGTPIARLAATCFVARLYGVDLGVAQIAGLAAAITLVSFYTPGIPSGSLFILAPLYEAFGIPVEGIGLILAVDLVPDMFLTTANVTADMAVAALLGRTRAATAAAPVPDPGVAATDPAR